MSLEFVRGRVVCLIQMMGQAFACVGHGRVVCREKSPLFPRRTS